MKLPFKKARIKKKAKWLYKLRNYNAITRAGITANPLEMYNPVSLATVSNNTLVKHNGLDFVGGDTDEYSYDFFTKVAGSNLECPCNYYYTAIDTTLQVATSPNWVLGLNQATIDKFKTPDGTTWDRTTSVNGGIAQALIEVDLTPLCNSAFGGSNSALKSALKSINVDCWAMGSGSNGGVSANSCKVHVWNGGSWVEWANITNSVITKVSNSSVNNAYIQTANKLYILIASQYASDGTIPSSVSLDYLKVTVQLNRIPDTVSPISVNLPKYFGVVVKGFSPMWDINNITSRKVILKLFKDANNQVVLRFDNTGKLIAFVKSINSSFPSLNSAAQTNLKNQVFNILIGQSSTNMFMYILKNNGTVEKISAADSLLISGLCQLYIGQDFSNTLQADSFLDNLTLIDLEKLGKSAGFTDAEATAILNGTDSRFSNPELFDINAVTLHVNASRNNGVITLNATGGYQQSYVDIPVLPNNRYEIKVGANQGQVIIDEFYNNITLRNTLVTTSSVVNTTFITGATTNKIRLKVGNASTTGTFTFSNISLKRKD